MQHKDSQPIYILIALEFQHLVDNSSQKDRIRGEEDLVKRVLRTNLPYNRNDQVYDFILQLKTGIFAQATLDQLDYIHILKQISLQIHNSFDPFGVVIKCHHCFDSLLRQ